MHKSRLYIFTFLGVLLTIFAIGLIGVPLTLDYIVDRYITLQSDVNKRQAEQMASLIAMELNNGIPRDSVLQRFQSLIQGTDADRGFLCMINSEDSRLLCHPNTKAVGMVIDSTDMMIDDLLDEMSKTFGGIAKIERDFTGLLRKSPDDEPVELVHSTLVPGTNWRVNSHENIVRMTSEIKQLRRTLIQASIILGFIMAVPISWAARRVSRSYENKIEQQNADLDKERKKSDELLLNVLPPSIANRLKRGENVIADRHESVSVLFADLVGFTTIASKVEPEKVVEKLNVLFTEFDSICEKHGVEKIKTIGDAYMAVSGLLRKQDNHARVMLEVAREMNECMKKLARQSGEDLAVRIGIHSGPIVAGVIGKAKFSYDLWGDTVNTASRMESHGVSGRIHVSNTVYNLTSEFFTFDACGEVQIKGKGKMQTYLLNDNNAE